MSTSIHITDEVTPALRRLGSGLSSPRVNPAIGAAEVRLFQQHFINLRQNKNNWPSTHFWADAARATSWSLLVDGVVVSVNKLGVRQRIEGGEIHAKPGGFLTIPAREEYYGHRAREFNNLRVQMSADKTKGALVTPEGGVAYWLVQSVTQRPDASVIPSVETIVQTAVTVIEGIAQRAFQRGGAS